MSAGSTWMESLDKRIISRLSRPPPQLQRATITAATVSPIIRSVPLVRSTNDISATELIMYIFVGLIVFGLLGLAFWCSMDSKRRNFYDRR